MSTKLTLTKDISRREIYNLPPESAASQFYASKCYNALPKVFPELDMPRASPAMAMVSGLRKLSKSEAKLVEKREEEIVKRQQMDSQWDELRKNELLFREYFTKFNGFIRENEEKRKRAQKKIEAETTFQNSRQIEIQELIAHIDRLTGIVKKVQNHIDTYKIYHDYLTSCVMASEGMHRTIPATMEAYKVLEETTSLIYQRRKNILCAIQFCHTKMLNITSEAESIINTSAETLFKLRIRHDTALTKILVWENVLRKVRCGLAHNKQMFYNVKQSAYALYNHICQMKNIRPTVDPKDTERHLATIQKYFIHCRNIKNMIIAQRLRRRRAKKRRTPKSPRHRGKKRRKRTSLSLTPRILFKYSVVDAS